MKEQGDIQHGPSVLTGKRRGKTNKRKIISCVWGGGLQKPYQIFELKGLKPTMIRQGFMTTIKLKSTFNFF